MTKEEIIEEIGSSYGLRNCFYKPEYWEVTKIELAKMSGASLIYLLEALGNIKL